LTFCGLERHNKDIQLLDVDIILFMRVFGHVRILVLRSLEEFQATHPANIMHDQQPTTKNSARKSRQKIDQIIIKILSLFPCRQEKSTNNPNRTRQHTNQPW
jgi:hypothetical protein